MSDARRAAIEENSLHAIRRQLASDPVARAAGLENAIRREIGESFETARLLNGWSLRALAAKIGTSLSQTQRLLHRSRGGGLTLNTIIRAADALGLEVRMSVGARAIEAMPDFAGWVPGADVPLTGVRRVDVVAALRKVEVEVEVGVVDVVEVEVEDGSERGVN